MLDRSSLALATAVLAALAATSLGRTGRAQAGPLSGPLAPSVVPESPPSSAPAAPGPSPAGPRRADEASATSPDLDAPPKRRAGVVLGGTLGASLAGASGFPNDTNYIGDPNYYAASGMTGGFAGEGLFMGALSDYLSFGFWFGGASTQNAQWKSTEAGGGLRVELFPAYWLGGVFRDFGVFGQFGIGSTTLRLKSNPAVDDLGVGSFLSGGVFYEFRLVNALGGHFALGPSLEYAAVISQPMERHGAMLGARFLWYGGK